MASIERCLLVVLSALLIAGGSSFRSRRLLGVAGDGSTAHSLPATSTRAAAGQWEWKTAGAASHTSPPLPRRTREISPPSTPETSPSPLLEDETTQPPMELEEDETSQPGLTGSSPSAEVNATSASLQDASTEAALVHRSTRRDHTAPPHGRTTTAGLSEDFTESRGTKDGGRPSHTTARPTSTTPPRTAVATSATSVAAVGPDSKRGVPRGGSTWSPSSSPPTANPRPSPTVQVRPPSSEAPAGPDKMVGQCLLAISLLALVAAFFVVTTFVLVALLLRQKRAYKLRQRSHTEMVCISSLLAAEEAEASGERAPRAKRAKGLAENGSETDMDNLTLNSFLPDH